MPKFPIDLGRKMSEMSEPAVPSEPHKSYPMLYLDWDDTYDLPDSGEILLKFKKTSESTSKDKRGEHQSVTLEIREICAVKSGKKTAKDEDEDGGKALDKLRDEVDESEDY